MFVDVTFVSEFMISYILLFVAVLVAFYKHRQWQHKIHFRHLNPCVTEFMSKTSENVVFSSDARFLAALDERAPFAWFFSIFEYLFSKHFHYKTTCVILDTKTNRMHYLQISPVVYSLKWWYNMYFEKISNFEYFLLIQTQTIEFVTIRISCNEKSSHVHQDDDDPDLDLSAFELQQPRILTPYRLHVLNRSALVFSFFSSSTEKPQQKIIYTPDSPVLLDNLNSEKTRIVTFPSGKYWVVDCELLFYNSSRSLKGPSSSSYLRIENVRQSIPVPETNEYLGSLLD